MAFVEFEEKTFEQLLTRELLSRRTLFFPPGQMLENTLGFDVALFSRHHQFWRLYSNTPFFRPWRRGIELDPTFWPNLQHNIDYFPSFRFNLFIQYKRPEFIDSPRAAEWSDWHREYYRYVLDQNQQTILLNLEQRVGHEALVVHASPVFRTYQELWTHSRNRKIYSNSNFATAQDLKSHNKYSYAEPGFVGVGHSESSNINGRDLFEIMNSLIAGKSEGSNEEFLLRLGNIVDSILSKNENYNQQYIKIKRESDFSEIRNYNDVFSVLSLFTLMTNSIWLIGTE